MFSSIAISKNRNHKRGHMRTHVPAISYKGHRPVYTASNDFYNHGYSCEYQDILRPLLASIILYRIIMAVLPVFESVCMHFYCLLLRLALWFQMRRKKYPGYPKFLFDLFEFAKIIGDNYQFFSVTVTPINCRINFSVFFDFINE